MMMNMDIINMIIFLIFFWFSFDLLLEQKNFFFNTFLLLRSHFPDLEYLRELGDSKRLKDLNCIFNSKLILGGEYSDIFV